MGFFLDKDKAQMNQNTEKAVISSNLIDKKERVRFCRVYIATGQAVHSPAVTSLQSAKLQPYQTALS